jgi:DNA-binding CsgD family transcriptional regulator
VASRPPYLVLQPPGDLVRVAADLTRRGWRVHQGFTPADEPWDLAPGRVVAVGVVAGRQDAEAALLCAVRGAGLVVTLDRSRSWAPGFLQDLARLEPATPTGNGQGPEPGRPHPPDRSGASTVGSAAGPARPATGPAPAALASGAPAAAPPQPSTAAGVPTGGPPAGPTAAPLTVEQCELLDLLATGHSIAEAARMRYLSLRTANRRVADARAALGVSTTRAAVLAYQRLRGR